MPATVGIMSMQRILNYGSTLQALSLRRLIEDVSDEIEVSFVDFRPGPSLLGNDAPAGQTPAGRAVAKVKEYNQVDAPLIDRLRFLNHKRKYARRYFPMACIPLRPNHDLHLDVQVIGSDEVFNCVQSNSNVGFSRDLFGHGSPARKLVSYAASFGNTTLEKIEAAGVGQLIASDLERFSAISVRDGNSADIIQHLTGRRPEIHVDPCLAIDLERLVPATTRGRRPTIRTSSGGSHPGRYILVYGYTGRLTRSENDVVRRYARSLRASIVCVGGVQECCDRFVDCSPFELPSYFQNAEAIITDTFHGTIFAVTQQRPFATIVRPSAGNAYGNQEKLDYLLTTLGLTAQRVVAGDDSDRIASTLAHGVDYESAGQVLVKERARTRDYLSRVIL